MHLPQTMPVDIEGLNLVLGGGVVQAPFPKDEPKGEECRIYAGLLDLGAPREEVPPIADAAEGLLKAMDVRRHSVLSGRIPRDNM
jgi:hypothetical protein